MRALTSHAWLLGGLALVTVSSGCKLQEARNPGDEPEGPGFVDTSSIDLSSGPPPPLDLANHEAIARRGVELYYMEVGMQLAYERGLPRVGKSNAAVLLPLASIDEGAHSGQVEFYRWRDDEIPESGELDPAKSHRWLVVPFLLRPNRVLENEQFTEEIDEKSDEFWKVTGVIYGAMAVSKAHPGGRWHMHPFRESRRQGTRRIRSTRVYMFGLDGGSPDLEVVVQDPLKKRAKPEVVEITLVHEPGDVSGASLKTRQPSPGPLTVARVKARGVEGGSVRVESADGSRWKISAETGAIELASETPSR